MARNAQYGANALVAVNESTFGRRVLDARLPVLALFGSRACPASRALRPLLSELAGAHAGQIRFASIDAEQAPLLAGQFGLQLTPTLLVVRDGEIATRVVGFVAPELLRLLCAQIAGAALPPEPFWSPIEATFEDVVIAPLLDGWGCTYVRQAASPAPARGRIDFLVYDQPAAPPLTLFENKRQILSAQAHRYARALSMPSCVVAAPAGLWIYACGAAAPVPVQRITSLELLHRPELALHLLRQMRRA